MKLSDQMVFEIKKPKRVNLLISSKHLFENNHFAKTQNGVQPLRITNKALQLNFLEELKKQKHVKEIQHTVIIKQIDILVSTL